MEEQIIMYVTCEWTKLLYVHCTCKKLINKYSTTYKYTCTYMQDDSHALNSVYACTDAKSALNKKQRKKQMCMKINSDKQ